MQRRGHGGGCCGVNHLFGFGQPSVDIDRFVRRLEEGLQGMPHRDMLAEVILTENQFDVDDPEDNVRQSLTRMGWQEVSRFVNPNTGNICVVFHRARSLHLPTGPAPLPLQPETAPAVVVSYALYRIRFTEEGLVNDDRQEEIRRWEGEPGAEEVNNTIRDFKARQRRNTDRWRFQLRREEQ